MSQWGNLKVASSGKSCQYYIALTWYDEDISYL
jgi:hypothetical protein